jgi:hypothetical protein
VTLTGKATGINGPLTSQPRSQQVTITRSISVEPRSDGSDGRYVISATSDKTGWTESFTDGRTHADMTLKQVNRGKNSFVYCWTSDQSSCGPQGSLSGPPGLPTVNILPDSAQGRTQLNFGGPDQFSPDPIELDQVPSGVTCTVSGSGRQQWVDCQAASSTGPATASVSVQVHAGNGFDDLPPLTVKLAVGPSSNAGAG